MRTLFLIIAGFSLACMPLNALERNRKTYLSSRTVLDQLPLEYGTYQDQVYRKKSSPSQKTTLQAALFYQATTNDKEVGAHFGKSEDCNSFSIIKAAPTPADANAVLSRWLIHNANNEDARNREAILRFKPEESIIGMRIDLFQDLGNFFNNCFFQMSFPVMIIEHRLKSAITETAPAAVDPTAVTPATEPDALSLTNFFHGTFEEAEGPEKENVSLENLQEKLTKARIRKDHSRAGVGDIDFNFGYKVFQSDQRHLFVKVTLGVPTGNESCGNYLFEPICGNGGHVALGLGLDTGAQVWSDDRAVIKILGAARHKYLFEGTETRTPGVKGLPLGQYYLAARLNNKLKDPLFPAANVITQKLLIKPGHQLEGMIAGSFSCSNFVADAGYNLFWKDSENVWFKRWKDNVYGIVPQTFNVQTDTLLAVKPTSNPAITDKEAVKLLNKENLDLDAVRTPAFFTHTIFASFGYNYKCCDHTTIFVGIGGSYELATDDDIFDRYSVWLKAGVSF